MPAETPSDVKSDPSYPLRWQEKLGKMTLRELRAEAALVNAPGSNYWSLYAGYVNEELNFRDRIWVSQDKTRRKPSELDDAHLDNAIAKISRDKWRGKWLKVLQAEKRRRAMSAKQASELSTKLAQEIEEDTFCGLFEKRE